MGPPTGGMMEGLLVSNSPFLGDFLDPPLQFVTVALQTCPLLYSVDRILRCCLFSKAFTQSNMDYLLVMS